VQNTCRIQLRVRPAHALQCHRHGRQFHFGIPTEAEMSRRPNGIDCTRQTAVTRTYVLSRLRLPTGLPT
jgi:hypothetical protein